MFKEPHLKDSIQLKIPSKLILIVLLISTLPLASGCQTAYYNTLEKFGYQKREVLVDRVGDARDAQQDAKEQFQSALEKFTAVLNFRGGELEEKYEQLSAEFRQSEGQAQAVSDRIDAVEDVSEALFEEWETELDLYSDESLRRTSAAQLKQTQQSYARLIRAMQKAERKIAPVLSAFRDQVLFLKHNLNARAVASLQDELNSVETNVASLIREMNASINEANMFIDAMAKS